MTINPKRYGKKIERLVMNLPEEERERYLDDRERSYQRIVAAYLAHGRPAPPPTILSGET